MTRTADRISCEVQIAMGVPGSPQRVRRVWQDGWRTRTIPGLAVVVLRFLREDPNATELSTEAHYRLVHASSGAALAECMTAEAVMRLAEEVGPLLRWDVPLEALFAQLRTPEGRAVFARLNATGEVLGTAGPEANRA